MTFCPAPKVPVGQATRHEEQVESDRQTARHWQDVCRRVEERDGPCCRVCGRKCAFNARTRAEKADPHHVIPRSQCGADETWNVVKVCRFCHDQRHSYRTLAITGNADERNEMGKLAGLLVERLTESGWETVGMR